MIARRVLTITMIALLCGFFISCSKSNTEKSADVIHLSGAGATFPAPLYKKWIEEYQNKQPSVAITYKPVGSGEGVKQFAQYEVDFAASDAAMSDEQIAEVKRGVKLIPATAGIIVLAYNIKDLNGQLRLPREVYADIFGGKIKYWDDPRIKKANPDLNLPSKQILLVTRQDSSGTTFAFTNHLGSISQEWIHQGPGIGKAVNWPINAMAARGNEGVAGRIKLSEGAIGYVEYGFAKRAVLQMAWLENKTGRFVEPLPTSGQAALSSSQEEIPPNLRMFFPDPPGDDSYPIVTYSWILLYGQYPDTQKADALKEFIKWGITEGQQYSEAIGYCKVPSRLVGLALKALEEIRP
ncbi:MAG TPA: phosphate ABC transporter substrate-binding protein PstS [Desulfomonilaceae bacterium]|nr:phosphate ABC transporter substrate-binding protein PstS [Desulfomonilaceae bacterium]